MGTEPRLAPVGNGGDARQSRALKPWGGERAANVFATMVRHVDLFEVWSPFAHKLLLESAFSDRHREIVILRVSWRTASTYEWGHHVRMARRSGLSDAEIESLAAPDPGLATPIERALVAATDELLDSDEVSDATWGELEGEFSSEQLVELLFLVGGYRMLAMALKTLRVSAERTLPPLGRSSVDDDDAGGGSR